MRQELARHLHHQVTDISQQLDTILCGKQRRMTTGALTFLMRSSTQPQIIDAVRQFCRML